MFRFDDLVVDPATFSLTRSGVPVRIEPKALEVLILLIERRDRVVSKQEMLDEVWRGTVVTENALTRSIAQIRKVLGDDLEAPRYIQTVPTKGYRFIAEMNGGQAILPVREGGQTGLSVLHRVGWIVMVGVLVAAVLIVGSALIRSRARFQKGIRQTIDDRLQTPPIAARPLVSSERLQEFPSFSPDANRVVYSVDVDGTPHLFASAVTGEDEVRLTRGEDGQTQPSWSPDGKSLAYVSARRGGIWIVPVAGGEPVQLTQFGSRPVWSPDGTEIAFQSEDSVVQGPTGFDALPPSTIWIVNVASRRAAALTKRGQPIGGHGAPSWRPDGKRLAFSSCDLERCAIYTIARDASQLEEIVMDTRRLTSPVFGRDGRALYYILVRYPDCLLLSIAIDGDGRRTATPRRLRQSSPGIMQQLTISRDGFRFAWTLVEESSDVFMMREGSQPQQVTRHATSRTSFPSFAPDGSKIAYCVAAAGEDSGVWVADADGRNPRAVAVGPGLKQHTHWTQRPWDVYYSAWRETGPTLFQISLITGRSAVIARLPRDASSPMLSPDGTRIAFNRTIEGVTSVWTDSLGGDDLQRVTSASDLARYPVWSPSGKFIALQVRRPSGGSAVAIVPAHGGAIRVVTKEPGENWPYSWSADEKQIAFAGRRGGVWNVFTVDVATGATRRLSNNESTAVWCRSPALAPSGGVAAYESGMLKGNVWVSEPRL